MKRLKSSVALTVVFTLVFALIGQPVLAEGFGAHRFNVGALAFALYVKVTAAMLIYTTFAISVSAWRSEAGLEAATTAGESSVAARCKARAWLEVYRHSTGDWEQVGKKFRLKEVGGRIQALRDIEMPLGTAPGDSFRLMVKGKKGCAGMTYFDFTIWGSGAQ